MNCIGKMRVLLFVVFVLVAKYALAQNSAYMSHPKPDLSTITIQAPYGFWYPSTLFNQPPNVTIVTSYQGIFITGLPTNPPILGHFDKSGRVVNGDYVLVLYVDIDTAPITKVWFNTVWGTVDQPVASGPAPIHDGEPLGQYEFALGATNIDTQIRGTEGTVYLGIALLTRANQRLETAWGVTVSQVIRIDDTISGFPYGNYILPVQYSTASFSIGGAAHFSRH